MILYPFIALSAIGLGLSIAVHLSALFGVPNPLGSYAWGLHAGIFVVWIPTVLVAQRYTRDFKQRDFWRAALRGCPNWMRVMTMAFFGYAFVNFAWFMASGFSRAPQKGPPGPAELRGFSGHWMAFYSAALATLYSATRITAVDDARRCLQGHAVGPLAKFCEQCGSPIRAPGSHPYAA